MSLNLLTPNRRFCFFPLLVIVFVIIVVSFACSGRSYRQAGGIVWNTIYNITWNGPASIADSVIPVLDKVGASASAFDSLSTISRINRNETDLMDSLLMTLFQTSLKINSESGGKFDPTVGPLVQAWGFGKGHTPTADTLLVDDILKYVGISKCRLEGNRLVKPDSRMEFNYSAIAKGLGCDEVAAMMARNGVNNYLIEIGGEIRASGLSPRGDAWVVSIDAPRASADSIIHESALTIDLNKAYVNGSAGVATSGNYRNFHSEGGKTFGHTIDPFTGRPAHTDVVSATVVAATAMEADAYATAVMAMGSAEARKMCARLKLAVYIMTDDGKVWASDNFKLLII